jgi:hypothetical protein
MSTNLLGELAASNGTYYLNANGFNGRIDQIIVRGEGVEISRLFVFRNGQEVRVDQEYLSGSDLGSVSVPNGLRITPKNNEVFSGVALGASSANSGLELVLAP